MGCLPRALSIATDLGGSPPTALSVPFEPAPVFA